MKMQNKENAKRTRRRKKVYDKFLTRLIETLTDVVGEGVIPDSFSEDSDGPDGPDESMGTLLPSTLNISDVRQFVDEMIVLLRRFVLMRVSPCGHLEEWDTLCDSRVAHCMPYPCYADKNNATARSSIYKMNDAFTCRIIGLHGLAEDTENRCKYFKSVIIYHSY